MYALCHDAFAAVRDPAEAWERHILDSLALLPTLDAHAAAAAVAAAGGGGGGDGAVAGRGNGSSSSSKSFSVIDVGTGAGLPGMVLAVVRPQWKVRRGWGKAGGRG